MYARCFWKATELIWRPFISAFSVVKISSRSWLDYFVCFKSVFCCLARRRTSVMTAKFKVYFFSSLIIHATHRPSSNIEFPIPLKDQFLSVKTVLIMVWNVPFHRTVSTPWRTFLIKRKGFFMSFYCFNPLKWPL